MRENTNFIEWSLKCHPVTAAFSPREERASEIQNSYVMLYQMPSFDETGKITKNADTIKLEWKRENKAVNKSSVYNMKGWNYHT